jgi:hypothetical protein
MMMKLTNKVVWLFLPWQEYGAWNCFKFYSHTFSAQLIPTLPRLVTLVSFVVRVSIFLYGQPDGLNKRQPGGVDVHLGLDK